VAKTFTVVVTPVLEPRLEPGESPRGVIACSYVKPLSGNPRVLGVAPRKGTMKVGEQLATWDRGDLTIATEPGRVATKVTIDVSSTGERFELEATMVGGGFNDALLAEIGGGGGG
jgi:hypothetical protein